MAPAWDLSFVNMQVLFNELPGVYIPLKDFAQVRHAWWADNGTLEESFQVCQFNLILHFGYEVSAEEGLAVFQKVCELTRDYPCRVWVICPQREKAIGIEAKLFGICHLLESHSYQKRICEAIIVKAAAEDLVQLYDWISSRSDNDLPLYFLSHKSLEQIDLNILNHLTRHAKKILWDSSLESCPDTLNRITVDLSSIKLTPLRQSLGYFLADYSPEVLIQGLQSIAITTPSDDASAHLIGNWLQERLMACAALAKMAPQFPIHYNCDPKKPQGMGIEWIYDTPQKFIQWEYHLNEKGVRITACLDGHITNAHQSLTELNWQEALQTAIFSQI